MIPNLNEKILAQISDSIYEMILRSLSFPHSDNLIMRVYDIFENLLKLGALPVKNLELMFIFLIHSLCTTLSVTIYYDSIVDYTVNLVKVTN